jgi:hypothetical protein
VDKSFPMMLAVDFSQIIIRAFMPSDSLGTFSSDQVGLFVPPSGDVNMVNNQIKEAAHSNHTQDRASPPKKESEHTSKEAHDVTDGYESIFNNERSRVEERIISIQSSIL